MRYVVILMCAVAISSCPADAQHDTSEVTKVYRLLLIDGSEIVGTILKEDSAQVEFQSVSKISMLVPRNQIKTIVPLRGSVVDGEFRRSDPNYTRLFFAPTGRALKNGQGYFSAYEIFFPFVAIGIGDIVTLAGGMSLIPGASNQIFYFAPKITPLHLQNFDLSAGVLYINALGSGFSGGGIVYGVGTYGSSDHALTVGLGWGFAGGEIANKPILLLGGELRLSNSIKLISENWIPPGTDLVVYSFGFRFFGENLAADLGFFRPSKMETGGFPFIPWIGFAYNFGAR
ncbi:MAG: hypothetical protein NTZ35_03560 [Ignavibacteriales bacterium]|nr:hypothetical protein [Ignavibacteriales bacterium]